jgi:hypothetical protein
VLLGKKVGEILWNILGVCPRSWHPINEILGISAEIPAVFLYANKWTGGCGFLESFRMGAGHHKDQGQTGVWGGWEFPALPLNFQGGKKG